MNNSEKTRKALVSSLMALVMCFSMFIGTTMAWFTDTATTTVNTIQAGKLDIDLVDADGNSIVGSQLEFKKAEGATDQPLLWEPGSTYQLQDAFIENNGNLALKYKVTITGIGGDAQLNEAIDWTITVNGQPLDGFEGVLAAGEKHQLVISGHMREDAGNRYQGQTIENIAITVSATQYTAEYDSSTNTYDENAQYAIADGVYVNDDGSLAVYTTQDLVTVASLANSDPSITSVTLKTDDGDVTVPVVADDSALNSAIADGNSVIVIKDGTYAVPSVAIGKTVDIVGTKDAQLTVSSVINTAGGSTLNFTGITVNGQPTGDFAGMGNGTKANYTDCTFTGKITLYGSTSFTNCQFNNENDYAVWTWGSVTTDFTNCTFNSGGKALLVYPNGTANSNITVNVTGCEFNDSGVLSGKAAIEITDTYPDKNFTFDVNINNVTVNGFDITEENATTFGGTDLGTNVWGNKNLLPADVLDVVIDGTQVY